MTIKKNLRERFFLIISTSGGAGHTRAAEALVQAAATSRLPIRAEHYDCLDFTSKLFKRMYADSYLQMVNRVPELWGYLYSKSESRPYRKKQLLEFFDYFNYRQYLRFLQSANADAVICTHFLPFISISNELLRSGVTTPMFAATTDFDVHQYWVDPIVKRYFVYHEESAWQLQGKGVEKERISVKGIPLMNEFSQRQQKEKVQASLGLRKKSFTVLVLSGGFGVGRVEEIVQNTLKAFELHTQRHFNLLIVCGKNDALRANVERVTVPANVTAQVFGFVNNIHDLMDASDILISKSGGLTSAEAMAKGLPMIIVDPIPGQESRNAGIIVEYGAGWQALDHHNLSFKLDKIIQDPGMLATARTATKQLAKPHAARDILENVYASISHKP